METPRDSHEHHESALDAIDFDLLLSDAFSAGPFVTWSLRSRKHLGILQHDAVASILPVATDLLRARSRRVTIGLRLRYRTSDRAESHPVSAGFVEAFPMLSTHGRLALSGARYRAVIAAEVGGAPASKRAGYMANWLHVDLARRVRIGPFTGSLQMFGGFGGHDLAPDRRWLPGGASIERQWDHPAWRTLATLFENPQDAVHGAGARPARSGGTPLVERGGCPTTGPTRVCIQRPPADTGATRRTPAAPPPAGTLRRRRRRVVGLLAERIPAA